MPYIIQFLHPNIEAQPKNDYDKIISWNNYETHRRKYLLSNGEYLDQNGEVKSGDLTFWGEWEPQSEIIKVSNPTPHLPKFINKPFLDLSESIRTHTTDPYVFGENFKYFICRQRKNHLVLKHLEKFSMILFGSCINEKFCLDTLFVVSEKRVNYSSNNLKDVFPVKNRGQFYFSCIDPIFRKGQYNPKVSDEDNCKVIDNEEFVCYDSVSYEDSKSKGSIYSYVPSKLFDKINIKDSLFRQPEIDLDFLNPKQTMGIKSKYCTLKEINQYWDEIARQVEDKKLYKGIKFKTPPVISKNGV